MRSLMRSGFFWRFVGGFAFGALGIVTLHPAQAADFATQISQVVR